MKKQRRGLNRYSVLQDKLRSLDCQTTPSKYEAKEYHQLSPSGQSKRKKRFRSQPTKMNGFNRFGHHRVWRPIHRRAIKECSKGISRDWVNHLACSLTHDIQIIANTFVIYYYFSKLVSLINFNEYADQIIFMKDYKMKGLVQIVSLMITTRNNDDFRGWNQFILVYFYDFPSVLMFS